MVEEPIKRRVKLIISYDGTNYCGWQVQINGITVEEVINRELSRMLGEDIAVIGASRGILYLLQSSFFVFCFDRAFYFLAIFTICGIFIIWHLFTPL